MTVSAVDEFFDTNDFAVSATYVKGAMNKVITVIFDREYSPTTIGDVPVQMTGPKALCKTADVTGADNTATLTIAGVTYKVKEVFDDANGFTDLILTRD